MTDKLTGTHALWTYSVLAPVCGWSDGRMSSSNDLAANALGMAPTLDEFIVQGVHIMRFSKGPLTRREVPVTSTGLGHVGLKACIKRRLKLSLFIKREVKKAWRRCLRLTTVRP